MNEVVVLECDRRCGNRFVYNSFDGESAADARRTAVCKAETSGWRPNDIARPKRRGLRCPGCFARYGYGKKLVSGMYEILSALYASAAKCGVCGDHVATRYVGDGPERGLVACDQADCIDCWCCRKCGGVSCVVDALPRCVFCHGTDVTREQRSTAWHDLVHADALRAANAWYKENHR